MNNSVGTMLEQLVVSKGGNVCIMGGVEGSCPWAVCITDFVLTKVALVSINVIY